MKFLIAFTLLFAVATFEVDVVDGFKKRESNIAGFPVPAEAEEDSTSAPEVDSAEEEKSAEDDKSGSQEESREKRDTILHAIVKRSPQGRPGTGGNTGGEAGGNARGEAGGSAGGEAGGSVGAGFKFDMGGNAGGKGGFGK